MKLLHLVNRILLALSFITLISVSQVVAQDDTNIPSPDSTMTLTDSTSTLGEISTNALVSNPYGCTGQTNQPHNSGHIIGTINVTASTQCSVPVPSIYVDTMLQKRTCLGICWWSNVGEFRPVTNSGTFVSTQSPSASCSPGRYRGISNHQVIGPDSNTYTGQTAYEYDITC